MAGRHNESVANLATFCYAKSGGADGARRLHYVKVGHPPRKYDIRHICLQGSLRAPFKKFNNNRPQSFHRDLFRQRNGGADGARTRNLRIDSPEL